MPSLSPFHPNTFVGLKHKWRPWVSRWPVPEMHVGINDRSGVHRVSSRHERACCASGQYPARPVKSKKQRRAEAEIRLSSCYCEPRSGAALRRSSMKRSKSCEGAGRCTPNPCA